MISRRWLFLPLLAIFWPFVIAATEPVPRAVVEKYLFLPDTGVYKIGDKVYRWDTDLIFILYREQERPALARLAEAINESEAMGERRIFLLPPMEELNRGGYDWPNMTLAVSGDFFDFQMAHGPLVGLEDYHAHAQAAGCFALPNIPYRDRDHIVATAQIIAREDLSGTLMEDCLFRGLMISAGLMYTPALALSPAPLDETTRAEMLAVLALLYHPKIAPGMTRDEFFAVLEGEGLIAD
ncbi:MAG: hypothetical protein AAF495_20060 [Pseudomonadota bacterium]